MKKLIGAVLVLALTAAACGGSAPEETGGGGIAALDEEGRKDAPAQDGGKPDGKAAPKKDGGTAAGGRKDAPAGDAPSSDGGGAAGSRETNRAGGGDAPAASAAPAITPVPAGRYEYATEGERTVSGNSESLPETTTLTAAAPTDGTQRQTRDLRDSEGNGILTESDLVYRDGSVFLSYVKITARFQGGLTDVREFRLPRPQLIAPRSGGPGDTRSFTMEGSGTTAKVSIEALRFQDVTIAGSAVRALVVQTDIRFSGALEGYQRSMSWFWPKHLMPVREQVRTDVRNGPIRVQSNYVATARRLP